MTFLGLLRMFGPQTCQDRLSYAVITNSSQILVANSNEVFFFAHGPCS